MTKTETINKLPTTSLVSLQNLAEMVPGMIAVYNVATGKYVYVNQAVKKILGYSPKDLIENGREFVASLVHPDDLGRILVENVAALKAADKKGRSIKDKDPLHSFEYRIRRKDGRWIWLHTDGSVYDRDSKGKVNHVINVSIDITKRKEAEQSLRDLSVELEDRVKQRSEKLDLALKASNMGIWEWDIKTGVLHWSSQMKHLFGLRADETINYDKYLELLHPDDRPSIQNTVRKAIKAGKEYKVDHRAVWPDGTVHWLHEQGQAFLEDGRPVRVVGTAIDIDERKRTEAALEASQVKYKTLLDSNIIGILVHDLEGRILEANDTFLAMVGYTRKDLKQGKMRWNEMTPQEYKALDTEKVAELKTKGEAEPWEKEYIRKDSSRVPVLLGVVMLPDSDNIGLAIVIDITDRQQLADLNKSKDEFISIASHQLRTPATAVKQYVGMLMAEYFGELSDKQMFMLQSAYESNERQLTIIDDLLRVARLDAGEVALHKETIDVESLLSSIVREQSIRLKARKQIVSVNTTGTLMAYLDKPRMHMVLGNMLDNASKYTPQGKDVSLRACRKGDNIVIEIEDQGVGIHKKDFDRLFQKFSRIDNPLSTIVGGSGLGLYWSKRVVDLHGGSIDVKSRVGRGTTFTVTLPVK